MKRHHVRGVFVIAIAVLVLGVGGVAASPQVAVQTEDSDVVVDGNYVRVVDEDGVSEVDWRHGGTLRVTDTDSVLVDLGAVEGADHIRLALQGDILFDFGSAAIRADAARRLAQVAHVIRQRARGDVLVVGHTDSVGDEATNQKLSEARALSVIRWLGSKEGIPASMMIGRGLGESQPVAHNTTPNGSDNPAGRAQNRRVEIFVATTERANVRDIAGLVRIDGDTVDVAGVAQIQGDEVRVGDVTVSSTGVVSSGGSVSTGGGAAASAGASKTSSAGKICSGDCPEGNCRFSCSAGSVCDYSCSGGDCYMECAAGGNCSFSCDGGDCRFSCAYSSSCATTCRGGDCTSG